MLIPLMSEYSALVTQALTATVEESECRKLRAAIERWDA
jgi:hypothetical protein